MIFSKASGVNDSIFGKSQYPIKALLEEREEAFQKGSQIEKIFGMEKSNRFAEKYTTMTQMGDFEPVGEGGAYPQTSLQEGYYKVIEPETWKNEFEVTQEMVEDARLVDIKSRASNFMGAYGRTREKFAANFLNSANATTFTFGKKTFAYTCMDNLALLSTAHTSITSGTGNQSNYGTSAFTYDNLATVEEAMQKFTDDDGNLLNINPDTIIIPNAARIKKLVSDAVFTESGRPGTTDNSFNYHAERWNVIVWNYLTVGSGVSADPWYTVDIEYCKDYGLKFVDRIPLTVRSEISANDNNVFKGRARFNAGVIDWRFIYGNVPS